MTKRISPALVAVALVALLAVMPALAESNLTNEQIAAMAADRPYITIMAAGDQDYYVGETIEFLGDNTITDMTYLFITGPGLPEDGAQIHNPDPAHSPLENDNPASYQQVSVKSDHTWSWKWDTTNYVLEDGIYHIHAVPRLYDKNLITPTGTALITIKKSAESTTSTTATPTATPTASTKTGNHETVLPGVVTIKTTGDQHYYFGDEIEFTGTNTGTYKTYLFITGPNLPENGAMIDGTRKDPRSEGSLNPGIQSGTKADFKEVDVQGDHTWSWKWGTSTIALAAGTYTIYAVALPYGKDNLEKTPYGTTSVILRKQSETATATPAAPVATPIPTTSPGFGALITLIGLGAVAFIVIRR